MTDYKIVSFVESQMSAEMLRRAVNRSLENVATTHVMNTIVGDANLAEFKPNQLKLTVQPDAYNGTFEAGTKTIEIPAMIPCQFRLIVVPASRGVKRRVSAQILDALTGQILAALDLKPDDTIEAYVDGQEEN